MALEWQTISDWFLPPRLRPRDVSLEALRERRRMVRLVGLVFVLFVSTLLSGFAQLAHGAMVAAWFALIASAACASTLAALRHGWDMRWLVSVLLAFMGLATALLAIASGREGLVSLFWLALLPLVALSLVGPRIARWTLVLTLALMGGSMWVIYRVPMAPIIDLRDAVGGQITSLLTLVVTMYALIRAYDAETEVDIAELERRNGQLNDARASADTASRAKSEFLATMSHEIRTPMNGVLGMTSVMLGREGLPADVREGLTTIQQSGGTLMAVINDILDFSKIESGRLVLEREPVDLRAELMAVRTLLEGVAAEHRNELRVTVDDAVPPWVGGDAVRLRQIALNLISNALKFTNRGRVDVRVGAPRAGLVQLVVRDSGIGMTPDVLGRLFTPFTQADASTTRRFGGTGLGLAIVRRLVQAMNGDIEASSDLGQGSRFIVTVPLEPVAEPPLAAHPPVAGPARRLSVLLAEDNPINQRVARGLLEQLGHQVVLVADGQQALDQLAAARFDVVLMDCHMPVMDGFEATRLLRLREGASHQPVIALTAASLPEEQARCFACGMDAVLLKPVQREELSQVLTRFAQRQPLGEVA